MKTKKCIGCDKVKPQIKPQRGDIAFCSVGCLGMITSDEPQEVEYSDRTKGVAWIGIQLRPHTFQGFGNNKGIQVNVKAGDPWSSKHPQIVCHISDLLENLDDKVKPCDGNLCEDCEKNLQALEDAVKKLGGFTQIEFHDTKENNE